MVLKKEDKIDLLYGLLYQYAYNKERDKVWQRELSRNTIYNEGRLIGALMVYEYDLEETDNYIKIITRKNKKEILSYFKGVKINHEFTKQEHNKIDESSIAYMNKVIDGLLGGC